MEEISQDSRFSHMLKDAKFRKLPKREVKVKVDKRFQSMFHDKKFKIKYNVDKRGRSVNPNLSEDLKRYYEVSNSDSDSDSDGDENESENESEIKNINKNKSKNKYKNENKNVNKIETKNIEENKIDRAKEKKIIQNTNKIIEVSEKEREGLTPEVKKKLKNLNIDYARGEGAIFSDSSSDEETSEEEEQEFYHGWGELDKDAEKTDESTHRLAVCNLDWDRIEATDLMILFNSFLPAGGVINSVTIYPSEFGLQRMKEEEEKGPAELTEPTPDVEDIEFSKFQMEKLRKYQLNRLKYYYAVVEFDSVETADAIYKECDGLDYECSSSKLDLRFIPNDTTFDQKPRETCTSLPNLSTYKPKYFVTSALTKAKVDLTWDETDVNRQEAVKSIYNGDVDENLIKKYLACSSSEEEKDDEEEKNQIKNKEDELNEKSGYLNKYKALLLEVEKKEMENNKNKVDMEITWNLDLQKKANENIKDIAKEKETKTPFQKYLEKRKQKKKMKQLQKQPDLTEENQNNLDNAAFSDDDIPSDIDLNDPYFKEELGGFKSKNISKKEKVKDEIEDEEAQRNKAELELLLADNDSDSKHFSLKKIEENEKMMSSKKKKKRKSDFHDNFRIDVNDERFSALYTSHHFNIDPADPQFKATNATKELIKEKLKRREMEEDSGMHFRKKIPKLQNENDKQQNQDVELSHLIKNIKKNAKSISKKL